MSNSSILPIDRKQSDTTTLGQSAPGSDANKVVLHIPQISSITEVLPSDCIISRILVVGSLIPLLRYSQYILGLFCFRFMAYQPPWSFNAKSSFKKVGGNGKICHVGIYS